MKNFGPKPAGAFTGESFGLKFPKHDAHLRFERKKQMFDQILVPTDFSDKSGKALDIATRLALKENATLHLLHVIEIIADTTFEEFKDFYTKLENRAQRNMNRLKKKYEDKPVRMKQHIVYGSRTAEILRFSQERQIDLIVLNSHKIDPEDPSQGWGTISYKVGILSQCPVMLVK